MTGRPPRAMQVPPAREGSLEDLLHRALPDGDRLFVFPPADQALPVEAGSRRLQEERDHRAIGVVYRPQREKWDNYVSTIVGERYDAFYRRPDAAARRTCVHGQGGDLAHRCVAPTPGKRAPSW